jgi:mRNA interferase MazF
MIVAPMITGSRLAPFRVPLSFERKNSLIVLDQLRTLDKRRLVRRLGAMASKTLRADLARPSGIFAD